MKIEELHEILKKEHKKYVRDIETINGFDPSLGPDYKELFITKNELTIIITQIDGTENFEFWIQNNDEGEGATISSKMKGSKVIALVDLIIGK